MTNKDLATITPYTPPYWEKRVWNPSGRNAWERKVFVALELGSAESLEKLLVRREKTARWREKPYLNAFKVPMYQFYFHADILEGKRFIRLELTPQKLFQQWRAERARIVEDEDVEWSNHNIMLAEWEDTLAEKFQTG